MDPQTEIFLNLEELKVTDNSGYFDEVPTFSGLCKNYRNIKKLTLETSTRELENVLVDILPHFVELKEIHLTSKISEKIRKIVEEKCQQKKVLLFAKFSNEEDFF